MSGEVPVDYFVAFDNEGGEERFGVIAEMRRPNNDRTIFVVKVWCPVKETANEIADALRASLHDLRP